MFKFLEMFLAFIGKLYRYSPFYPYLIYFHFCWKDNEMLSKYFSGDCIEIGAGSLQFKEFITNNNQSVKTYTVSDFYNEDEEKHYEFDKYEIKNELLQHLYTEIVGKKVNREHYDLNLDCRDLSQIQDEKYDTYFASEVLEHVDDLDITLKESYRILKKGGKIILTVPFMYQEHGPLLNEDFIQDYNRLTRTGWNYILKKNKFKNIYIFSNISYPLSISQQLPALIISKFKRASILYKILFLIPMLLSFLFINLFCLFLNFILGKNNNSLGRFNIIAEK